jgi:hypothetical protein
VDDHVEITQVGGSSSGGGGTGGGIGIGGIGGIGGGTIDWCDVKEVVLSKSCWRCHHTTPENEAPFQLCRYQDTQVLYAPGFLDTLIWEEMQRVVSIDFMPPVELFPDMVPPVQPLDATQKATLMAWFAAGAPLGDPACDGGGVSESDCLSGEPSAGWFLGFAGGAGAGGGGGTGAGAGAGGVSGAGGGP